MGKVASNLARLVAIGLVVALVVGVFYLLTGGLTKSGTAYFAKVNNIYPGDHVKILGMKVGAIDEVTPEGNKVRVDFHYDAKYSLPADVNAALMSPTLVATRFIQLDPAYTAGPEFPDGGTIPVERTAVPVEFDDLKNQLDQLADSLGPQGVNSEGALNRFLTVIHRNGVQDGIGQGQNFHDLITELSKAAKTVSDGRDDLFGTVSNLAHFSSVLSRYDRQIIEFDHRLADVAGILNDNSDALRELLPKLDDAGHQLDKFLDENGPRLTDTIDRAGSISRNLAKRRDDIAGVLHVGPNAVINFANIFNPRTGEIFANVAPNQTASFGSPGDGLCAAIVTAAAANEKEGQEMCVKYLGPIFRHLAIEAVPVGATPVAPPRGSTPTYGDIDQGSGDTNPNPNGTRSDVPRSSQANGNDRTYPGPAGLPGLLKGGDK